MVTYKSATSRTVSLGRLQINNTEGVTLDAPNETLEALVKEGFLVSDGVAAPKAPEAPKAPATPKPSEDK